MEIRGFGEDVPTRSGSRADQEGGGLGQSREAASPGSCPASYETGGQTQEVLTLVSYHMLYGFWRLLSFVLPVVLQVTLVEIGCGAVQAPIGIKGQALDHNMEHTWVAVSKVGMGLCKWVEQRGFVHSPRTANHSSPLHGQ